MNQKSGTIQNLFASEAGSDSNYATVDRAVSSGLQAKAARSQMLIDQREESKQQKPAVSEDNMSPEFGSQDPGFNNKSVGPPVFQNTQQRDQNALKRRANPNSKSVSPMPRKAESVTMGIATRGRGGRSAYSMTPISEGRGDARSASTSNKGDKLGRHHKMETLKASFIRESMSGSIESGALRSAIRDANDDKVSWQPPPVIKETIIEANLEDESPDPIKVTHKYKKTKKVKKMKKIKTPVVEEQPVLKPETPKFKPPAPIVVEKEPEPPVMVETPKPESVDIAVEEHMVLRGVRNRDIDAFLASLKLMGTAAEVDIDGGFEFVAEPKAPVKRMNYSEPAPEVINRIVPVDQDDNDSEAGSALSEATLTDSIIELRARVAEKRSRALRRLRGIINIAKVWKLSKKKPIVQKFQRGVRRLFFAIRFYKHMIRKRRYPAISNPRATKAIYRLMMLVRMKMRNTEAMEWREKWTRARRRLKGILNIQSIVKFERRERIEGMYEPDSEIAESEFDEVAELDESLAMPKQKTKSTFLNVKTTPQSLVPTVSQLRGSAVSAKAQKQVAMILNHQNRPSQLSNRSVARSHRSNMSKRSMMSVKTTVACDVGCQTTMAFSQPNQPVSGAPTSITGQDFVRKQTNNDIAAGMMELQGKPAAQNLQQLKQQQMFTNKFTSALNTAEAEKKQGVVSKGSRIVEVSAREAHQNQAMTLSVFVKNLSTEFMSGFGDLTQQLQQVQRKNTNNRDREVNFELNEEASTIGSMRESEADYGRQSQRSNQNYYGEIRMTPKSRGVFQGQRTSNGEYIVTNEDLNNENIVESKCDNGHSLYVTRWTKREPTNCSKTKDVIKYKDQMVTCTVASCQTAYSIKIAGCTNGHVLHRRIISADQPLSSKNDSCLRCMRNLQKEMSVKWCGSCKASFCPEGCDIKRID